MSRKATKKELVGPWRSLHVVIWVLGLYILFSRGWFFPGILVLIAISALYEGLLARFAPHAFAEVTSGDTVIQPVDKTAQANTPTPVQEHRLELLPQVCPSCNAPIRGHEVKWTGLQSANCPYCGTNLPMKQT